MAWLDETSERRRQIIIQAAQRLNTSEEAIEKDWWVTQALHAIFMTQWAPHLVFKGGTSLSKGWGLIERFSEDIDLAINRSALGFPEEFVSGSQVRKLREKASAFITGPFREGLQQALIVLGIPQTAFELTVQASTLADRDPQVLELAYTSVMERGGYLRDKVIIEIGGRSLIEPFSPRPIQSLIAEVFPNQPWSDSTFTIPVVDPKRTFLEKAFLLHEGFLDKGSKFIPDRKSRHLYDLERIMYTAHAEEALSDHALYEHIIEHRSHFTPVRGLSYVHHHHSSLSFVPPEDAWSLWETDYASMRESMIYGEAPAFKKLILRLKELQVRFRLKSYYHSFQELKERVLRELPEQMEMPSGDHSRITHSLHYLSDIRYPRTRENDTITYRLTLEQYDGQWYGTEVNIQQH